MRASEKRREAAGADGGSSASACRPASYPVTPRGQVRAGVLHAAAARLLGGLGFLVATASAVVCPAGEFRPEAPLAARDALGAGIHAFHVGDHQAAYDGLTDAILAGLEDPRAYYFRGLAGMRLGRLGEAEADFAAGAELEASSGSMRRVSLALERVQGHDRLTLERFRARARLAELTREREARGRRYSGIEEAAGEVRRRRRPEDILPDLVAPRPEAAQEGPSPEAVEEVPPPKPRIPSGGKPGTTFDDESAKPAADADDPFADEPDSEGAEKEMAAEVEDAGAGK